MLVPPVAQGGPRPSTDPGSRGSQSSNGVGAAATTLWPLAPAQPCSQASNHQATPPLAATPAPAHSQGVSRYGLYSLFPGGGGGSYVAATPTTPGPPTPARAYHTTTHKVSESVFSAAVGVGGYTWGAPTPPPGSPYSPVPVAQLELLAKNLASLAPPGGQQALSFQGVNVGSLHQHTQHTLNLAAGLHHLHHGAALHQNTFSPQLSLVTGNPPTLTINGFSSGSSSAGSIVPTTGVLLQEYQSPTGSTCGGTSSNGNDACSPTSPSNTGTLVVQTGGTTTTTSNVGLATTVKKREAFLPSQGQPVKLENKSRQPCICRNGKTKFVHSDAGCSRTLPVVSSWNGQDQSGSSLVKRESAGASMSCQVAEVSTSLRATTTTAVKIEPVPPKSESGVMVSNAAAGGIPVGIAVARQRLQHQETASSMRNVSLSHQTSSHHTSYHHFQPDNLGSAMAVGGTTVVHCGSGGEERSAHLAIPSGALAPSLNGTTLGSSLNSSLGTSTSATTWPSTLWQYPAAAMPMEPVGFPQMGVGLQGGLQLVRDPGSGQLLLIHATGEQMQQQQQQQHQQQHHQQQQQQTVVWPNYPSHPGGAPPPLLLPPPPPVPSSSLQLLSDIGGARLVLAAESKRKQQPNLPIVKIEADCAGSPATIITSAESTKALQTVTSMTGTLVPDTPLVTTLHYYPHAPTLLHLGQPEPAHCRSQATSPVSCLTPPPEATPLATVQDASNQTETPEEDVVESVESHVKLERSFSPCQASPKVYDPVPDKTGKAAALACKRDRIESPRRCPASFQDEQVSEKCQDMLEDERMTHGPRIIEITEENCDSFHENFEFFNYRKDPLDRRRKLIEEEREQEEARPEIIHGEKPSAEESASVPMEVEPNAVSVEPEAANQWKQNHHTQAEAEPINGLDCTSCKTQKNWVYPEGDARVPVKSFDMPSIDYEEQPEQPMVIKRERSDAEECERTSELESRSQKPRVPKHSVEKFHPCIENVVEKLKKNAAAAVFQQQSVESESQQVSDCTSRRLEETDNGRENNNDPEKIEVDDESIRKVQEVRPEPKRDDCEKKSRQNVDLSGLELLSSSIEQLEHLKPESVDDRSPITPVAAKENGGNVDSPLGLLCALAEQRFMEEVGGERRKQPPTPENSEEVSIAGRVLMNLGKTSTTQRSEKRRFQETSSDPLKAKRFKDHQETISSRFEGNRSILFREEVAPRCFKAKRNIDFSDVDQVNSYRMAEEADEVPNISEELEAESARRGDEEGYYRAEEVLETTDSEAYEPSLPGTKVSAKESEQTILEGKQTAQKEKQREFQNIDSVEMDMRVKMADIQRRYKEKQKELSRLTPKKDERRLSGEFRRQSKSLSRERELISSPVLTHDSKETPNAQEEEREEATAPTLSPSVLGMQRCNVNLVKLTEPRSHIKLIDSIPSISIAALPVVSPATVSSAADVPEEDEDETEKQTDKPAYDTSSPAPMIASSSSASKKRKVGRPRKLMCSSAGARHLTETIVAKKPKSKSSLVGYLLNSKNKHAQNKINGKTCTSTVSQTSASANAKADTQKPSKCKIKPAKQTPLHSKNVISSIIAEKAKLSQEAKLEKQAGKVKPKLKAEPAIKNWNDPETVDWNGAAENIPPEEVVVPEVKESTPIAEISEVVREKEKHEKSKKKKRKSSSLSPTRHKSSERDKKRRKSSECKECKECAKAAKVERTESIFNRCKLTSAHLAIDQLRVLTAMGGLFYAGRLSAIQAPDVYAITLDGERGNRPHIHSREEILRDAIVEICPSSTKELPPGTRLCAYWSQQYRCLYPGTSVEPSEPDPELDEKFVSVEFDDGDSGRIALDDIRLLQPDYPVVEYDPNPLLSLGKRRRQASASMEDKRSAISNGATQSTSTNAPNDEAMSVNVSSTVNEKTSDHSMHADAKSLDEYREKKKLKKRRRDKLRKIQEAREGKRKHKRHRCCEEHRKHKHRKHRRHRHKHSHRHCDGGDQLSGGESSSGQKSEEEHLSPLHEKEADEEEEEEEEEEVVVKEVALATENATAVVEAEEKIEPKSTPTSKKADKKVKSRERQESVESRSKMAAFLPARQLWGWAGKGYRRPGAKGRAKKQFFRAIQRGSETIQIGDSAVFLSTGRPDRPYIGKIESMWETSNSNMIVKVKWFYHPEETVGCPTNLAYPGALFESPHMDENDVQTISHKCEVLPLQEYTDKLGKEPHRYLTIYDNNDIYYLAGYYDPTTYLLTLQPGVV